MANLNDLLKAADNKNAGDNKVLSKQEEIKLGTVIQSSNSEESDVHAAITRLVLKNIRLVFKISHSYKRKEFEFEDIVSYGILGLYKAAEKYDPKKEIRFASYARHWIKESIMKAIREYSGHPKIPVYLVKNLWCISRIVAQDDTVNDIALAQKAKIPVEDATYLRSLLFKFVQFDNAYSEVDYNTPEKEYIRKEREQQIIQRLKKCLTSDQFKVLAYSCEICGYPRLTFTRIKKLFNISNPRKVKRSAIKVLKQDPELQRLYEERSNE